MPFKTDEWVGPISAAACTVSMSSSSLIAVSMITMSTAV